ncbi:hypothetical protein SDJN02_09053, partial [Cucurbita argyrosperma subsp. argyrosperma]
MNEKWKIAKVVPLIPHIRDTCSRIDLYYKHGTLDRSLHWFASNARRLDAFKTIRTPGEVCYFCRAKKIRRSLKWTMNRNLHVILEAASSGQTNINPYGWTTDGSERTLYPAQVLPENFRTCVISPKSHDCKDTQWSSPRQCGSQSCSEALPTFVRKSVQTYSYNYAPFISGLD